MADSPLTIAPQEILSHLEKILQSPLFLRAERQSRLLRFLVENTVNGDTSALRETSLGVEVYDRPADFDPKQDTIVRVEVSRLRSRLIEYYDGDGKLDPLRITVPRGGYIPQFQSLNGTPMPAAIPAAIPEEIPQAPQTLEAPPAPQAKGPRWHVPAALAAILVLAAAIWFWRSPYNPRNARIAQAKLLAQRAQPLLSAYIVSSTQQARELLERAAELDPDSPTIQYSLSGAYIQLANLNFNLRAELSPKALLAAERTRALAPDQPIGYLALVHFQRDLALNWTAAQSTCQEALRQLKNPEPVLSLCSSVESTLGNFEVAIQWAGQLIQLQPQNSFAYLILGQTQYRAGLLPKAIASLEQALALRNQQGISPVEHLALIAVAQGKPAEGLALLDRRTPYSASNRIDLYAYRGYVAAKAGQPDEALKMRQLVDRAVREKGAAPVYLAWIDLGLGNAAAALANLTRSVERRDDTATDFIADPASAPLRNLPEFRAAAKSLGLSRYAAE